MCPPKTPKYEAATVETPVYAQEQPAVADEPVLKDPKKDETTTQKANRRGVRQLRTDLGGLGEESANKRSGLNIPT